MDSTMNVHMCTSSQHSDAAGNLENVEVATTEKGESDEHNIEMTSNVQMQFMELCNLFIKSIM